MQKTRLFKGCFVLVTGASSGIGLATVKLFLREGARVGAHYCTQSGELKGLVSRSRGMLRIFQADFSQMKPIEKLYADFMGWSHGRIDILVNNAGAVGAPLSMEDMTEEAWDYVFQVNTKAPFWLGRAALADMVKVRSGRIINISSIGVKFGGGPKSVHYSASKIALEGVTRSLAKAGAPHNVFVNAVRSGVTDTPLHQKTGRHDREARAAQIPLKRFAAPEEIANAILYLSSPAASFVTNTILDVAGGE